MFIPIKFITTLLHSTIVEIQIVEPKLQQVLPLPCLLDSYHIVFCPCRNILWVINATPIYRLLITSHVVNHMSQKIPNL